MSIRSDRATREIEILDGIALPARFELCAEVFQVYPAVRHEIRPRFIEGPTQVREPLEMTADGRIYDGLSVRSESGSDLGFDKFLQVFRENDGVHGHNVEEIRPARQ